jgi:DNA-binding response OmpR family regulator
MLLEHEAYEVLTATDENAALELFNTHSIDLVMLDYKRPEPHAGRAAAKLRTIKPRVPIMMLSLGAILAKGDSRVFDAHVSKSENPDVLLRRIEQLLTKSRRKIAKSRRRIRPSPASSWKPIPRLAISIARSFLSEMRRT